MRPRCTAPALSRPADRCRRCCAKACRSSSCPGHRGGEAGHRGWAPLAGAAQLLPADGRPAAGHRRGDQGKSSRRRVATSAAASGSRRSDGMTRSAGREQTVDVTSETSLLKARQHSLGAGRTSRIRTPTAPRPARRESSDSAAGARQAAPSDCASRGGSGCTVRVGGCNGPVVDEGLQSNQVARREIQQGPRSAGFDPCGSDGLFGPRTRVPIRGLAVTRST